MPVSRLISIIPQSYNGLSLNNNYADVVLDKVSSKSSFIKESNLAFNSFSGFTNSDLFQSHKSTTGLRSFLPVVNNFWVSDFISRRSKTLSKASKFFSKKGPFVL